MAHNRKATPAEKGALAKKKSQSSKTASSDPTTIDESTSPSWDRFGGMFEKITDGDTTTDLPTLAAEYIALAQQVKEAQDRQKQIRELVQPILEMVNEASVSGDFFVVRRYQTRTPTKISETKLLDQGVDMDTIEAAREGGNPYWVTQIQVRGE